MDKQMQLRRCVTCDVMDDQVWLGSVYKAALDIFPEARSVDVCLSVISDLLSRGLVNIPFLTDDDFSHAGVSDWQALVSRLLERLRRGNQQARDAFMEIELWPTVLGDRSARMIMASEGTLSPQPGGATWSGQHMGWWELVLTHLCPDKEWGDPDDIPDVDVLLDREMFTDARVRLGCEMDFCHVALLARVPDGLRASGIRILGLTSLKAQNRRMLMYGEGMPPGWGYVFATGPNGVEYVLNLRAVLQSEWGYKVVEQGGLGRTWRNMFYWLASLAGIDPDEMASVTVSRAAEGYVQRHG